MKLTDLPEELDPDARVLEFLSGFQKYLNLRVEQTHSTNITQKEYPLRNQLSQW